MSWVPADYQERSLWRTRIDEAKKAAQEAPALKEKVPDMSPPADTAASVAPTTNADGTKKKSEMSAKKRVWNTLRPKRALELETANDTPADVAVAACFSVSSFSYIV